MADLDVLNLKTIRNHISSIRTKLEISDWTQAVQRVRSAWVEYKDGVVRNFQSRHVS